jgi:AraC family transcriptional regulator
VKYNENDTKNLFRFIFQKETNMNSDQQLNDYKSRINKVIDYIEQNLDRDLTLDELAEVACFSKFHFHRIFASLLNETLFQFIQRLRLEKASMLLITQPDKSITEIAFQCGFTSSSIFARNFKEQFDQTASQWRQNKSNDSLIMDKKNFSNLSQIESNEKKDSSDLASYNKFTNLFNRRKQMAEIKPITDVAVKKFPHMHVAYVRYIGPYAGNSELFEGLFNKLFGWAGPRQLINKDTKTLIIYHDDPEITDEQKLRVSVCMTVPEDTQVSGEIGKMEIEEGDYGVGAFKLDSTEYKQAWDYMYGIWLAESGYNADDRPAFEMYPEEPKEGEKKMRVDICVPVKAA